MKRPLLLASLAAVLTTTASAFNFNSLTIPTGERPDSVAIADLNGDGVADLAVTTDTPDKVEVRFGTGGGNFGPAQNTFLGSGAGAAGLKAGDIDGDGDKDLMVVLKNLSLCQVLVNGGAGTFSLGATFATGDEPVDLVVGDVNNDGKVDFATANRSGNSVTVLTNVGGTFTTATITAGDEPRGVALGDLDGDLDADVAFSNHRDRTVSTYRSEAGAFTLIGTFSVGANQRGEGVAIANIDGDADNDVLVASNGTGVNVAQVFLNSGSGTLTGPTNYNSGGGTPTYIAAGDLDSDGDTDIAVSNQSSDNVGVLANNGLGVFGAATTYATGSGPDRVTLGDLNNDGSLDMATANRSANTMTLLFNQIGATVKASPSAFTLVRGRLVSGGVPELSTSDNQSLVGAKFFVANQQEAPVQIQFDGTVATGTVSALSFTFEGAVNSPNLAQSLLLWDWSNSQWVTVDTRAATLADSTTTAAVTTNASRFVSASGELRARATYSATGPTTSNLWQTSTDFVQWTISR